MNSLISVIISIFAATISLLVFLIEGYNKKKRKLYAYEWNEMVKLELLEKSQAYICCKDARICAPDKVLTVDGIQYIALGKNKVMFGRDTVRVDVTIRDINISRLHFMITFEDNLWFIEDCGSSNGTFVNGKKVQRQQLTSGDSIVVGRAKFEFCST